VFLKIIKGLFRKRDTIEGFQRDVPRWSEGRVEYDRSKCTKCHLCVKHCPAVAIRVAEEDFVKVDDEVCIRCAVCTEVCPTKALKMKRK
jgi:2-oxoacid:acceptor oxidoreductase delta subunit (pyruvate/2-ketoisovalerate family)